MKRPASTARTTCTSERFLILQGIIKKEKAISNSTCHPSCIFFAGCPSALSCGVATIRKERNTLSTFCITYLLLRMRPISKITKNQQKWKTGSNSNKNEKQEATQIFSIVHLLFMNTAWRTSVPLLETFQICNVSMHHDGRSPLCSTELLFLPHTVCSICCKTWGRQLF